MITILFFGSPDYVVPLLQSLIDDPDIQISAVITQPDRPVGRKKTLTPTPVKQLAQQHQIPVLTPKEFDDKFYWDLEQINSKLDLAVLAAYGAIIPHRLLTFPQSGFINIHPSLLPQYRGATPTIPPLLKGESQTGVSFILMDNALDHGPLIAQFTSPVQPDDNHETLATRLFQQSTPYLPEVIKRYLQYRKLNTENSNPKPPSESVSQWSHVNCQLFLPPKPQDHSAATYTQQLTRNDGYLPWKLIEYAIKPSDINETMKSLNHETVVRLFPKKLQPFLSSYHFPQDLPVVIDRFIRALAPWPGAWTEIKRTTGNPPAQAGEKRKPLKLKLLSAHLETSPQMPNTPYLILDTVRLEGHSTQTWQEFQNHYLVK